MREGRREGQRVGCVVVVAASGLQCAPHLSAHYLATERGYSQSRPLPRLRKSLSLGQPRGEGLGGRGRGEVGGATRVEGCRGEAWDGEGEE